VTIFWLALIAATTLAYVLLDGFDLGVGMLFFFAKDDANKRRMLSAISPVWDGNETWLVVTGTCLFGAFPRAYSALLSAFYLPLVFMLIALILRGVSFEFRYKATSSRWIWDAGFWGGSGVATFMQGLMVGALAQGVPMSNGTFDGGMFWWAAPFPVLCGFGLCVGYTLLGASWLAGKTSGRLQELTFQTIPYLIAAVLLFLALALLYSLVYQLPVMQRWRDLPFLPVFPVVSAGIASLFMLAIRRKWDRLLYPCAAAIFAAAFGTFAVSFWPYIIPFSLSVDAAAAPLSSLKFMFWGAGLFAIPIAFVYTFFTYQIFKGKVLEIDYED
jgi:cytochrome d ubiquinol oxidase subunit II